MFVVLAIVGIGIVRTSALPTAPTNGTQKARQSCKFGNLVKAHGEHWTHRNFNVTCQNGRSKVLNCLTERGVPVPLGTRLYIEAGIRYSCQLNMAKESEKSINATEEEVPECDHIGEQSRGEYVRDGFLVSCVRDEILGCLDENGDLVKSDHFYVLPQRQLRRCEVYGKGRWAKSERKGCFNGTGRDDPDDAKFHVPIGRIWQSGPFELRCGDDGLHVYKCLFDGRRIHTGTAWFDRENVLNVCK